MLMLHQAAEYLENHFRFNSKDKEMLARLFEAYKKPSDTLTQLPDLRTAAAYVTARGLSIGAVIERILAELAPYLDEFKTITDYGGGPGTFLWVYSEFATPTTYMNVDNSLHLLEVFKLLRQHFNANDFAQFQQQDYFNYRPKSTVDLSVFSYTLCENPESISLVKSACTNSNNILIVEPGTPLGFANILKARDLLISKNFKIIAPCTHHGACPLKDSQDDWCHFITRHNRTKTQMFLKNAEKSYEDEKFIFLFASKTIAERPNGLRVISRPQIKSFAVEFQYCADAKTDNTALIYKKSHKEQFKAAKKSRRGDLIHYNVEDNEVKPFGYIRR